MNGMKKLIQLVLQPPVTGVKESGLHGPAVGWMKPQSERDLMILG
jgi:hypothetical protein